MAGLAGAGRDWQGLAAAGAGWQRLAGSGAGGRGWQRLGEAGKAAGGGCRGVWGGKVCHIHYVLSVKVAMTFVSSSVWRPEEDFDRFFAITYDTLQTGVRRRRRRIKGFRAQTLLAERMRIYVYIYMYIIPHTSIPE